MTVVRLDGRIEPGTASRGVIPSLAMSDPTNPPDGDNAPSSALAARDKVRRVAPKLIEMTETVVYGDVWERPELSKRDRSIVTISVLAAMGRKDQLPGHLQRALDNGVTAVEIGEIITHIGLYAGWPAAMTAGQIASDVLD